MVDQDTRIEDMMRIELLFDCSQCISEELRPLAIVPSSVISTECMMVCDCTTRIDHGI